MFQKINRVIQHMQWYDIALLKMSVLFFTLFLLAIFPDVREVVFNLKWYYYLIVAVLFAMPLWLKLLVE